MPASWRPPRIFYSGMLARLPRRVRAAAAARTLALTSGRAMAALTAAPTFSLSSAWAAQPPHASVISGALSVRLLCGTTPGAALRSMRFPSLNCRPWSSSCYWAGAPLSFIFFR
jgi:hypothetical protein